MKRLILFFFFALTVAAKAQEGYNYKPFAIGLDVSYERGYTNVQRQDNHISENLNFVYNYSPYIPITAELQFGNLSGGGITPSTDRYGRQYDNHYEGLIIHGDFQLGEVIDYSESDIMNIIKNFYFGSGIGIIFNSNTVQRTNLFYGETVGGVVYPNYGPSTYVFPGVTPVLTSPFLYGLAMSLKSITITRNPIWL